MRLKKLQLLGFKSFADKTTLEFDAGITAIVGPNGCGKSNIADALRWVFGEQSAKSMRGNKMLDLIFAGSQSATSQRKPLNFAEVSVTLSDINGALAIPYEEICVTRRLHRSGESEYLFNGQPVRLKELQNLFLDSGIGRNIEQGKIDQVINFTPLERRHIFEEAAGILRFLQRKKESLRKLEQMEENIVRVKDIHQEVEKQIVVLRQQAEKATHFKKQQQELEEKEKALLMAKWAQVQKKILEASEKENEHTDALVKLNEQAGVFKGRQQELQAVLTDLEKDLLAEREELFKKRSEKEIKSREKMSAAERFKESSAKEKRWQLELEDLMEQELFRQKERLQLQKQQKELIKDLSLLEEDRESQKQNVADCESEVAKLRTEQQMIQRRQLAFFHDEAQMESELKQNKIRRENNLEKQAHQQKRLAKLKVLDEEWNLLFLEKQKSVEEIANVIDSQRVLFHDLEDKINSLAMEISSLKESSSLLAQEINEGRARHKALLRLRADMEGFSSASKKLLTEASNSKSPLYGKLKGLYELISVDEEMKNALGAALAAYSQTIVVNTLEDLQAVLTFVKEQKLDDFSLICLETIIDADLMPFSENELVSLCSHVNKSPLSIHLFKNIFVSDSQENALKAFKANTGIEVWSKDNFFIDRHGVCFYLAEGKSNVFVREAEIKALESSFEELEVRYKDLQAKMQRLEQKRSQFHNEMMEIDKGTRRSEMRLVEFNFALQKVKGDLEKNKREMEQLNLELSESLGNIEQLTALIDNLELSCLDAKVKTSDAAIALKNEQEKLEKLTTKLKWLQQLVHDKEQAYQISSDAIKKTEHALHLLDVKDAEGRKQEVRLSEEIQMAREFQAQFAAKNDFYDSSLREIELCLERISIDYQKLEDKVSLHKQEILQLEKELQFGIDSIKKKESERYQLGILVAQLTSASQSFEVEIQERHQISIQEASLLIPSLAASIDQTEKMVRALRQQIKDAGDINMTSIEECKNHTVRYEFLSGQIEDLSSSKQELLQIIDQLEGDSRKLFKDSFSAISANFKKNFSILFNGGEADLQLTDGGDLLTAGIEIIAKPPGKQMRSISLLSGGEKCLTAIALLFAIFEVKPSPFCLLDEIDAPLDDSNVERFANLVKQFVDYSQFIIITHNRSTMAIADFLIGITMQEKGISRLLQMEFAKSPEPQLTG